jgi:hypothetical protein
LDRARAEAEVTTLEFRKYRGKKNLLMLKSIAQGARDEERSEEREEN